ncbi:DUF72 domain-containing protein [soil metagenome]
MVGLTPPLDGRLFVGTAGWAIPRAVADAFPSEGTGMARYASRFRAVEINATFYRPPRFSTLERWAATVGPEFRFSLKVPKAISHEARLVDVGPALEAFMALARVLDDRLGPLLLQLPPSLGFDPVSAGAVCGRLTGSGFAVACEPRHASWFTPEVDGWLAEHRVARVAADPAKHSGAGEPGGWRGLSYRRLHGSPRMYYSAYGEAITPLAEAIRADGAKQSWCIFDNTASGAAAADALALLDRLSAGSD